MTNQLYRDQFMEIYKSAPNFGRLKNPSVTIDQVNSVCGDRMVLDLKIVDATVLDARFNGMVCAVSKTSASIVTEYIKGKKIAELKKLTEESILEIIGFDLTESRKQCALLCYYALQEAIKKYDQSKDQKNY